MTSLEQSLALEIVIGFLVHNVALAVLILLLVIRFPCVLELLHLDLLPKRHGILDVGHICKMSGIWNSQTSHAMSMAPLCKSYFMSFDNDFTCKMSLKSLGSLVSEVSTNLTVVRDVEAMQLVQPVGDGLA